MTAGRSRGDRADDLPGQCTDPTHLAVRRHPDRHPRRSRPATYSVRAVRRFSKRRDVDLPDMVMRENRRQTGDVVGSGHINQVAVAKLAGLPEPVLARARALLVILERKDDSGVERRSKAGKAPQLSLFGERSAESRSVAATSSTTCLPLRAGLASAAWPENGKLAAMRNAAIFR